MTVGGAGMTVGGSGMTVGGSGMTVNVTTRPGLGMPLLASAGEFAGVGQEGRDLGLAGREAARGVI